MKKLLILLTLFISAEAHADYIKQKNANVYIVNIEGYENNLELHPAVVQHPELFEIKSGEAPEDFERLNFSTGE